MSDPTDDDLDRQLDAALDRRRERERADEERRQAAQAAINRQGGQARLLAATFNNKVHPILSKLKDGINERLRTRKGGAYEIKKEGNVIPASTDAEPARLHVEQCGASGLRIGRNLEVTLTTDGNVLARARKPGRGTEDPMAGKIVMAPHVMPLFRDEGRIASSLDGFSDEVAERLLLDWVCVILDDGVVVTGR